MSKLTDLVFWNYFGNPTSGSTQTQYVSPSQLINYISEWKHIIVGRNNNTVSQKFKIDNRIRDSYFFQIVNKNNQIVYLDDEAEYRFYGSFIDARGEMHTLFYSDDFNISQSNVLGFKVNTYTSEYLYNVKRPREIDLTIKKIDTEINKETIVLRDSGIAYPTPIEPSVEPTPVVAGEGLTLNGYVMSLQNPLSTSFGAGSGITFIQPSPSLFTFAFGKELMAGGDQFVIGNYNEIDYNAPFIIGWGNSDERKNIFTVDSLGNVSGTTFYANGVQVATINEVSGITYTAGEGIGISDQNVISLTATIPLSTSQLTNDSGYITNSDLADYALTSDLANYATTGMLDAVSAAIPTAWVQRLAQGTGISVQRSGEETGPQVYTVKLTAQIPTSTSQLINDSNYATSSYVQNRVNISPIYNDTMTHNQNNYILPYDSEINIYKTKHYAYSDGKVYINALSTVPTNNNAITFEHHIQCYNYSQQVLFDGFVIDQNINVIGDLPSTFVAGTTYVFTRRLININNTTTEFISFAYSY